MSSTCDLFDIYRLGEDTPIMVGIDLENTADTVDLDPFEILNIIEEHGRVDTDAFTVLPHGEKRTQ